MKKPGRASRVPVKSESALRAKRLPKERHGNMGKARGKEKKEISEGSDGARNCDIRTATEDELGRWSKSDIKVTGPMTLFQALGALNNPQGAMEFIHALRELINSPELNDPSKAPGHLARLVELMVFRFERMVRGGLLDEVLPRLTALPLLYSPSVGPGAAGWTSARDLFHDKRVGRDAVTEHIGHEPQVARRIVFGTIAGDVARLADFARIEFARFVALRAAATAVCPVKLRRSARSRGVSVHWYHCGDLLLRWPHWLDLCADLPTKRRDNPAKYRKVADGILQEFFANPSNQFAEKIAGKPESDARYAAAVVEAKRAILDAVDRS